MRFIFAPDSFKGSLTAAEVCAALEQAALRHFPGAETRSIPIADGGEGTVEAILQATGGQRVTIAVTDPLGAPVTAQYARLQDGSAVLEMAQASGLPLVGHRRDPLAASSYGTGEMLRAALAGGCSAVYLGLGGSATNDGGMGMLTALGAVFEDAQGRALRGSGAELARVARVSLNGALETLGALPLTMMSDVTNPLLGETGATAVYGAQKGADAPTRATLEAGMAQYADALERAAKRPLRDLPGAGAAGGMGAALYALGAAMRPGIEAVLDAAGFDAAARGAALVITGEGRIDGQSVRFGKAAAGVAKRCAMLGVPLVALVGGMQEGAEALYDVTESSILTTVNAPMSVEQAMSQAQPLLEGAADRLFRLLKIGRGMGMA